MRHRVEDAVQNLIALAIICHACAPACVAEDHEELHGVNHPPVSIQLASDPLKAKGTVMGGQQVCNQTFRPDDDGK